MLSAVHPRSSSRWDLIAVLVLFGIVLVSRFLFVRTSIWEWDEILFSSALHKFNVWEHSPHPPGYPGYVALTRGLNYFLHKDVESLVFVNAFFGSLLVFPLYLFYRPFSSHAVAVGATALSLFNPAVWLYSETGYNDVTSLFWIITSLAFLYRYEDNRFFYLGMLSMAVAMSIRPQHVLFGVFLIPLLLWLKARRGELRAAGIGLGVLAGACLVWFVPLVLSAGGLQSYIELMRLHAKNSAADPGYLIMRHEMSLFAFVKTKFRLMWGSRPLAGLLAGLTALGVGMYLRRGDRKALLFLAVGFLPSALVDFLWLHFRYCKYTIPTAVLVSFFSAYGLLELWPRFNGWRRLMAPAVILGLVLLSAQWTLPALRAQHTAKSPLSQVCDYIQQHLNPKDDLIISDLPIDKLLPGFVVLSQSEVDEDRMQEIKDMNWYCVGDSTADLVPRVKFYVDSERLQEFGSIPLELYLSKTDVLYTKDYQWKKREARWYPLGPEAHCFLKNTGRAKVLALESARLSPGLHDMPVFLELDGRPLLEDLIKPRCQWYPYFIFKGPDHTIGPFSTLTLRTLPPEPGDALVLKGVYWWDIEPAPSPETQVIDFTTDDRPAMVYGWSEPETDGKMTFAWSVGRSSALAVRWRPQGVYELSFRATPIINPEAPNTRQAVAICVGELCSPRIDLDNGWKTYTRWLLGPVARAEGDARLTFVYRFTCPRTLDDGSVDNRPLGVAFDYVKLTWLGSRPVEDLLPQVK